MTIYRIVSLPLSVSTHHASLLVHLPELGPDEWTETWKVGKADQLGAALSLSGESSGGMNIHLVWRHRKIWMASGRVSSPLPEPSSFALSLVRTMLPFSLVKSEMIDFFGPLILSDLSPSP